MKIKVKDVADFVGGKISGDPDCEIERLSKIQDSRPGDLTFLYLTKYQKYLATTEASAVIVKTGTEKNRDDITYIEVEKPEAAFQNVIRKYFAYSLTLDGIAKSAFVDKDSNIGKSVAIGENVVVEKQCVIGDGTKVYHNSVIMENVRIGKNVLIYPNVTIRENCVVGDNVIIHSGTVIGSDGFGYSLRDGGGYDKIPQIGNVVLEDDVEIGSNVSIDRAAIGSTIVRKGTKIDNLVQIAHNVEVGSNTAISSQVGIAGSTKLGNNCIAAGQVGIVGHIDIADGVILGAQSGISKSITKAGTYSGSPAQEINAHLRMQSQVRNISNYAEKIKLLEKKIEELEKIINHNNEVSN